VSDTTSRDRAVRAILALVNTQRIDSAQTVWGVPGTWTPLPAGESGLLVSAGAADGVRIDGAVVDGSARARGADDPRPSAIRFSDTVTGSVIATEEGCYALRVWDADSDGIRDFGGIERFAPDPDWVVEGRWMPLPDAPAGYEPFGVYGVTAEPVTRASVSFEHGDTRVEAAAFLIGGRLALVFSDATSGVSSYSVGRLLFAQPHDDGTVTLDFNAAVLPPCAFSYNFSCPVPPPQNRFTVPVEAGEKRALAKDGSPLHE
jgi:uncharacterized protein (DUF1684 family)